jgi:hypothetical protein
MARDNLFIGGLTGAIATKEVLMVGTDTINTGAIDALKVRRTHTSGMVPDAMVVFQLEVQALHADDTINGVVSHCATVGGTYTQCAVTKISAAAMAIGERLICPLPADHLQFLRFDAMPHSTGTATTGPKMSAWVELGPNF